MPRSPVSVNATKPVLICGLLIVLGAALATNHRDITETLSRIGGAQSEGMVRFEMAVNRAGGVFCPLRKAG
jgi:hypothetical protein